MALFSTGDEIARPGPAAGAGLRLRQQPLQPDRRRCSAWAWRCSTSAWCATTRPALQATLRAPRWRRPTSVLTSGGVSVGDADYTRDVLARMGEVGVLESGDAARPAVRVRAAAAARRQAARDWLRSRCRAIPVAALVTLLRLRARGAAATGRRHARRRCRCCRRAARSAIRKRPGRTRVPARHRRAAAPSGGWQVRVTGSQGAGILRSMSEANALVVLGHDQGSVAAGEPGRRLAVRRPGLRMCEAVSPGIAGQFLSPRRPADQ
ncbi:MAG: hypothetical protein MZW92_59385 [Comamonadaceae bacterium]|nr:hypothetical protein [Comamonadaceae bacterium]